jgi:hypothetical protein
MIEDAAVDSLLRDNNNWGRWGDDDDHGTLNLLTEERCRQAATLVAGGERTSLGRVLEVNPTAHNPRPVVHMMTELHADSTPRARGTASDWFGMGCHGFATTHLDAFCHQSWRGQMYNGNPTNFVTARAGTRFGGVDAAAEGVFARGVFLDVPRLRQVDWLEPGDQIEPGELDDCLQAAKLTLRSGDVVIVSTGRDARAVDHGELDPIRDGNPGLSSTVAGWLAKRQPALLVTDVQCDTMIAGDLPHPMPLHVICLVGLGIHIVDNARLDQLATACLQRGRAEFAFTMTVPRLPRATGAPVNPLVLW